jgi:hypothetical protein
MSQHRYFTFIISHGRERGQKKGTSKSAKAKPNHYKYSDEIVIYCFWLCTKRRLETKERGIQQKKKFQPHYQKISSRLNRIFIPKSEKRDVYTIHLLAKAQMADHDKRQ